MVYPNTDWPTSVDTLITRADGVDIVYADEFNYSHEQIRTIQTFIGETEDLIGAGIAAAGPGGMVSPIADGASSIAFILAARDSYSTGKILSVGDDYDTSPPNYTQKFGIDADGIVELAPIGTLPAAGIQGRLVYKSGADEGIYSDDGTSWNVAGGGASVFEVDSGDNEIQPVTADIGRSFIVGSQDMDDSGPANDVRMFFDKDDGGSFRAGVAHGAEWDSANRGTSSFACGEDTTASGNQAHAEGYGTIASGLQSHAEGYGTTASGEQAHAEGYGTNATNYESHAEGVYTDSTGFQSHAEGWDTTASGSQAHSEGMYTTASGNRSHAEGRSTTASAQYSHAEGYKTEASGYASHAQGESSTASGSRSHAEGYSTEATQNAAHAEGWETYAGATGAHSEGESTSAYGFRSHAQGHETEAWGDNSFSWGYQSSALLAASEAHSCGSFDSVGDGQNIRFSARGSTTSTTPLQINIEGDEIDVPNNAVWGFTLRVLGRSDPDQADDSYFAIIEGIVHRSGVNVSLVPGPSPLVPRLEVSSAGASGWAAYVQDSASGYFDLRIVGDATNTVRWVAEIQASQIIMTPTP